jgi:hypothetical protein
LTDTASLDIRVRAVLAQHGRRGALSRLTPA